MPPADTEASAAPRAGAFTPSSPDTTAEHALKLSPGSPGYRRANFALFAAGLATFALLYSTQALLPAISADLALTPAQASLTVTATTGALAIALLPVSALSEKYGRTAVMTASVFSAVLLALVIPFAPDLTTLVVLRAIQGAALAGLPATAMAYLAEEIHPKAVASAIGLYVAGNSIGGMSSRVFSGAVSQALGWRTALFVVGLVALACAVAFRLLVPAARNFQPGPVNPRALWRTVTGHLSNPLLRRLYVIGLLFMAVFGAVYTVLGYRLMASPFGLSQTAVGLIFLVYLVGTAASAGSGVLLGRVGRRGALYVAVALAGSGLLLSLSSSLVLVLAGLVLITGGFFTGHSVASSAVSRTATTGRAQASALYLTAYYVGNSVGGTLGASAYHSVGWGGTAAFGGAALAGVAGVTLYATRVAARTVRAGSGSGAGPSGVGLRNRLSTGLAAHK
ncbi:MFS transporter [Streptomyces sp. SPB162]|uniref:MFS transporter n=1 Tax=Streptomyces sp. SPB162 TaxID=2940560 RepID=UPI002406C807|nr:MFS transporter [Streptomyces sp. SPB162]MDF9815219.1 YNFM family putative membrane transporter [Streptomyces sp. SPB162]